MKMYDNLLDSEKTLTNWQDVDWKMVNSRVTKLRFKIFTCCKNKEFRKAKSFQRLMLKSKANLLQSIRRVTQFNKGKRTSGIDELVIQTPSDRVKIFNELSKEGLYTWQPKPVRRIYIPKPDGTKRPLGIPTLKDRIWQSVVKNALEPEWEKKFETSSYGFRPLRSYNDAINRIYVSLSKKSKLWIVDADISGCFDNIGHSHLLERLNHFPAKTIIEKWLKAGILTDGIWFESNGTPQGGIISPLLCNISLHGIENEIGVKYNKRGYIIGPLLFVRYADDIVILCIAYEDALLALENLRFSLSTRELEVSDKKTRIVHAFEGFDFLGFNFRIFMKRKSEGPKIIKNSSHDRVFYEKFNRKDSILIIQPSEKSVKNFKTKIKSIFQLNKQVKTKNLIGKLNPVIRGWALSKKCWHSNRTFGALDHYIYILSWRWIQRRHPQKNKGWLKDKYFNHLQRYGINNKWVFTDQETGNFLYQLKWTGIDRHIFIRNNALPDDPSFKDYFIKLKEQRYSKSNPYFDNRLSRELATSQRFTCPMCDDDLFNGESLQKHHIIYYTDGGKTNFKNLVLLHQACHAKITFSNMDMQLKYKEMLQEYKLSHPSILNKYIRSQKKLGLTSEDIDENFFIDFNSDLESGFSDLAL